MKILHIIDSMSMGGAQSLLVELLPVQKDMGHEVLVLELHGTSDQTFVKKLHDKGIKIEILSAHGSVKNPINIIRIIPYLKKFDIVHVHLFPANYWTAIAKFISFTKTPIVTTEHSTSNKRRNIKIFKYIDKFIYNRYQEVIACSDEAYSTFHSRFPEVKCTSIPNGVDISKYTTAKPYAKSELIEGQENPFIVTMVARFSYPKRQDVIIKAISKLPSNIHAVFVGGTEENAKLKEMQNLANELNVSDRIHFLYTRSDVPRILKTSDVIVMSSEYEGLSLSSIEGMASGHPFLASNVKGLKDVVRGAGELFEYEDSQKLSDIIYNLYSNKGYYNSVTQRCLKRASEYDIHIAAELYQEEYNKFSKL